MFRKTGVHPVEIGKGGVGGHGSTSAAQTWWARSWSSCSLSGVENRRLKRSFEVGVLSSGVKVSEFSSWLDRNRNQVEIKGFLWEMVANYDHGSCEAQVRPFVTVGLGRAKHSLSLV